MNVIYIYTIFNKNGKPNATGIKINDKLVIEDLYKSEAKPLRAIYTKIERIAKIFRSNATIITSNLKDHIKQFKIDVYKPAANIYDLNLPKITPSSDSHNNIKLVLDKMASIKIQKYHKVLANASYAYQSLEYNGLRLNYSEVNPIWSFDTYSGRSKTTGYNLHGVTDEAYIRSNRFSLSDSVLVHFDWICADIRAASLLSNDDKLQATFLKSDPYTEMAVELGVTRDEAKSFLLQAINSADICSDAFKIYPKIGDWLTSTYKAICNNETCYTLLGRPFNRKYSKNDLSVLNGLMQGSVAHAMQAVVRRVWDILPNNIVGEIHDSLVVCSNNDPKNIQNTIKTVASIMLYPFDGLINTNPVFPIKVSIGKKWRAWNLYKVIRNVQEIEGKTSPEYKDEKITQCSEEGQERSEAIIEDRQEAIVEDSLTTIC